MAITFADIDYCYYANNYCTVTITDSNDENNTDQKLYPSRDLEARIIKRKERLTHRWEGTFTAQYFPFISFTEEALGLIGFKSTVDCRALDANGNRDVAAQTVLRDAEKQRYITENGLTEV
jgi:hypothetical protein|tara:strand:+ start:456 stop:818 length:363 start_codon:yes stop_codon:yes gene_type:complete